MRLGNSSPAGASALVACLLLMVIGLWIFEAGAYAAPDTNAAQAPEVQPLPVQQPVAEPSAAKPLAVSPAAPRKGEKNPTLRAARPAPAKDPASIPAASDAELRDKWGIEVLSLRRTAGDFMVDFRYRVHDAEKAAPLFDGQTHPCIIDEATGAKFIVPDPPKVGQLRTTRKPVADKNYFMIFANPGQLMKAGSKISVIVGDLKIEHLTLE